MATVIVSGRVDARTKERADGYIKAAGMTVGEVIKTVWEHIAHTGEVPQVSNEAMEATRPEWEAFLAIREELSGLPRTHDFLSTLTDDELHDMKARDLLERYENL